MPEVLKPLSDGFLHLSICLKIRVNEYIKVNILL